MNKQLLKGITSLMLPLGAYAGITPSGAYQRGSYQRSYLQSTFDRAVMLDSAKISMKRLASVAVSADALVMSQGQIARELVVIDSSVEDKHVFYRAVKPGIDIVEIDSSKPGLEQLIAVLEKYSNLSALHIVSHAEDGVLLLGNSHITSENIKQEIEMFSALNGAMREGGDLLLYGCDLASGEQGSELLGIVQRNTHLDVAASADLTGNAARAGDWDLEIKRGNIETTLAFSEKALADFSSVLATYTLSGFNYHSAGATTNCPDDSPTETYNYKSLSQGSYIVCGFVHDNGYGGTTADVTNYFGALYVNAYVAPINNQNVSGTNHIEVRRSGGSFQLTQVVAEEFAGSDVFSSVKVVGYVSDGGTIESTAITNDTTTANTFTFTSGSHLANFASVNLTKFRLTFVNAEGSHKSYMGLQSFDAEPTPLNSDGTLTAGGGAEATGLATTADSTGEAVNMLDFVLTDGASGDGLAMTVSQVVVNVTGTSTDAERGHVTWRLNGPNVSNVTGTYDAGSDRITFSGLNISVADGTNQTFTVNAYFNDNTNVVEDHTFILNANGDDDLTVGAGGTQMSGGNADVTNGAGAAIDVLATQLSFTTQPAGSVSGIALTTQPVVAATDAAGNIDVDFTETITLTEASLGTSTNNTQAATAGVATFTNLTYTATADQQAFTLTANDQDGVGSNLPTVDANSVTSDVVATQLVFSTQPAPTSVTSGAGTSFSTVPVVSATNASGIVDTGYATDITLAEVNGAGSAIMTATGDTDGNGSTVSITPSSGVATFTDMQVIYTAAGAANETFNLRASSGGLSTADSSQLTSISTPTVSDSNISISGASGSGGAFKIGDTVTATWNNTVGGDNNAGVSAVTVDFSAFGGGAAVAAANSSDTWTATYTIVSGAIDGTNRNVSVTATNAAGNTTTVDTTNASVDSIAPTVTDGRISISGASGSGGAFKIGDTVTATWNNTAGGDNNSDALSTVSVNFTQFGGGAAVAASNAAGTWTATYTIVSGAIDGTNRNVSMTAIDDAGNTTTVADTTNAIVDSIAPTVSDANISISGASGSGGAYIVGDTVTATWNNTAGGDNNSDALSTVSVNFTQFGGGAAVAASNAAGTWTATYTIVSGAIDNTNRNVSVTAIDDAGNSTTAADTTNATVDSGAPSGHSVSFDDSTISGSEAAAVSFTFAGAEVGASYSYTITSSAGGTPVTGSGALASAGQQISSINVSGLSDGTLTLSVTLTDAAGNAASAVTDTATLDSSVPSGHSVSFDDDTINGTQATAISFTFASAEVGSGYSYTISSSGGGTAVTSTGTLASANQQISGIDVSGLIDGTLTLSVTLTDSSGNAAAAVTDTAALDASAPSGHSVSFDDDAISSSEAPSISFTFASAQVGADYSYTISSSGGGTPVTGTGTLASATEQITGINVSGLADGNLTLSVILTDSEGNAAGAVTDTATLDSAGPTASIVVADSELTLGETTLVTVTFNEAVSGFANDDLTVESGALGTVITSDGGITWTATLTPTADTYEPANTITLNNTGVTDTAGNTGSGTTASNNYIVRTQALTLLVTSALDTGDDETIAATTEDDEADGGGLSIREALNWVRAGDTITFDLDSGTAGNQGGTITLNGNQLQISYSNITLDGDLNDDGAADVTISANNASRVMGINNSLSGIEITGLTLTQGSTGGGGGALQIGSSSSVTVRDSNFANSTDAGLGGGGIYGASATLTMINSTVSGNTSSTFGGGIRIVGSGGTLNLINSTVRGNTSTGASAHGGGIQYGATGSLTIVNSTISGNAATGATSFGGGLRITSGTAFIYNSTVVGNASTGAGGGVHANGNDTFVNTVVAGNTSGAGATAGAGGSPLATGGAADDVGGIVETATNSYFGSNVTITTNNSSLNNQGTSNLLLSNLIDNGGFVLTHRPQTGSALSDAGSAAALPADVYDIDGDSNAAEALPLDAVGAARIAGVSVDIGAVEGNRAPELFDLGGGNTYIEDGVAVVIDNDVTVTDDELDELNGGNGNYSGASVTIARNGGVDAADTFSFVDGSGMSLVAGELIKNGQVIATVDTATAGQWVVTFTDANGELPERSDVNAMMQQITYASTSDDPDTSVVLDWTFTDEAGAPVTETASVTVSLKNDAPVVTATGGTPTFTENGTAVDLFSAVSVNPVEAAQSVISLQFTVTGVNNGSNEILAIDGSDVALTQGNALVTATNALDVSVAVAGTTATVTLSHATGITGAAAQAVVDGMTYRNTSANPNLLSRVVTLVSAQDNGGVANDGVDTTALSIAATVALSAVNNAPTISGTPGISTNQNALYSFTPSASDVDSATLTFNISNQPAWASFDTDTGIVSGTPGQAHVGTTTGVVITVSDGSLSTSLPAFNLTVVDVNDAPVISGAPATSVDQDVAYSFVPTASDLDGNTLTFSAANLPAWASVNTATGAITGTPDIDDVGEYANIVITVSDGALTASLPAFTLTVTNNAPVISGTPQLVAYVAAPYSFTPTASDVDSDALTFTATGLPGWLFLNTATGQISGTPAVSDAGMSYNITLTVSDGIDTATLPLFSLSVEYDGDEPVVTPPDEITLDAVGLHTPVSLLQLLSLAPNTSVENLQNALRNLASDRTHGGSCCITEPHGLEANRIMLTPGRHEVIWRATNQANLTGEAIQVVNVRPLISLNKDQVRGEGSTAVLRVLLNGRSPVYPLTVGFTVDGTASGDDHDLAVTSVTFAQDEIERQVQVSLTDDSMPEGNETLIISLDESGTDVGYANFGNKRVHEIQIVEENVAPLLKLNVQQNSEDRRIITQDGGVVLISAIVDDPNPADTHVYDWQYPNGFVVTPVTDASGTFDPAALEPGIYEIVLTVTEDNMAPLMTRESVIFQVIETAPVLGTDDSDDDGIDDATEGLADSDGDGQPDYIDSIDMSNVLNETRGDEGRFLVEGDPGLRLELGSWSLLDDADGAQVSRQTLTAGGVPADSVPNVGGYFDFVVRDIPAHGSSVRIVLPQRVSVPASPVYRKFGQGVWFDFVENARNQVASAAGSEGVCPPPGSDEYSAGLSTGHWCVQLTIEDGGPNDADGEANGTVVDPGGVGGKSSAQNVVEYKTRGGGGGSGGSLSLAMMAMLLLLVLVRLQRAHRPAAGLVVLLAISTSANAQPADARPWWDALYLQGGIAYAHSNLSRSEAESRLGGADDGIHVTDTDDKRMAWNLGLGYSFSEQWALEMSYLDLGEVEMIFDAPITAEQMAQIHPESGKGWTLSGIYLHPLQQHLWLQARLGLFNWEQDYETVRGTEQVDSFSDSGTDLLWGLGVAYQLGDNTTITSEVQGIDFDNDPTLSVGVGLRLRFD